MKKYLINFIIVDSFLEGFLALSERLINLSLVNLTFRTTMESKKQKYIKFLNENESFQNWIKNSPMQIIGFSVIEDSEDETLKVQLLFKNALYLFN